MPKAKEDQVDAIFARDSTAIGDLAQSLSQFVASPAYQRARAQTHTDKTEVLSQSLADIEALWLIVSAASAKLQFVKGLIARSKAASNRSRGSRIKEVLEAPDIIIEPKTVSPFLFSRLRFGTGSNSGGKGLSLNQLADRLPDIFATLRRHLASAEAGEITVVMSERQAAKIG